MELAPSPGLWGWELGIGVGEGSVAVCQTASELIKEVSHHLVKLEGEAFQASCE